jgi:hypothetical protein
MNATQYPNRQNRPNQFFAAGAAVLASALVLSSVLWLFAGSAPAASADSAVAQQLASAERV